MSRHDTKIYGTVTIPRSFIDELMKKYPRLRRYYYNWERADSDEDLPEKLKNEVRVAVPLTELSRKVIGELYDMYGKAGPEYRGLRAQLSSYTKVMDNPDGEEITDLRQMVKAVPTWLKANIIEGWVFRMDASEGKLRPFLVTNVTYHPPYWTEGKPRERVPACVSINLGGLGYNERVKLWAEDVHDKKIASIMLAAGFVKETQELVDLYNAEEKQFREWRQMLGEQFVLTGDALVVDGERDRWGDMRRQTSRHEFKAVKVVMDDENANLPNRTTNHLLNDLVEVDWDSKEDDEEDDVPEKQYNRLPVQFILTVYLLTEHKPAQVHMRCLKPYVYKPELRSKLVLPDDHADLLDTLTSDLDVIAEDVVEGKSGGRIILCQGSAGKGKTLTAEVYAEIAKRPLYRIHSGQLGTDAEGIEKVLVEALKRAERWNAFPLIDECDVFLMQRGADLERNAVVGVFLRVLEYYSGVLFLTTNRTDAVDEAILSRCIAMIKYDTLPREKMVEAWKVLLDNYGVKVETKLFNQLVDTFDRASPRDVKNLIRLTQRFAAHKKIPLDLAVFKRMAQFRGII